MSRLIALAALLSACEGGEGDWCYANHTCAKGLYCVAVTWKKHGDEVSTSLCGRFENFKITPPIEDSALQCSDAAKAWR